MIIQRRNYAKTASKDENYIVGQESTVVGDEGDDSVAFINLLFDNPTFKLSILNYIPENIQLRRKYEDVVTVRRQS